MHYRYLRAELEGSRFGLWLARVFGVKPKILKADLTPEEVEALKRRPVELPPGINNGEDE